jgi:hypothetical protein
MTSPRKLAANRRNGRKSRGPRRAAGNLVPSRNALQHGFAAITHRKPVPPEEVERFAKALCSEDDDPLLFEEALAIAYEEFVLRAITEQQLAVIERVREPSAVALAKGDNSLKLARARSRESREAYKEFVVLRDSLLEKYKDELPTPIGGSLADDAVELVPLPLAIFLDDRWSEQIANGQEPIPAADIRIEREVSERDEGAALEEAAVDLVRLDRYERRAQVRQDRAIRGFINRKLMKRLEAELAEKGGRTQTNVGVH